jgi:membrane dipeptidase
VNTQFERRATRAIETSLVWDNHGCMPLRAGDERFLPQLERYRRSGFRVVSLNVAFDVVPPAEGPKVLAHFRRWIRARPSCYMLLQTHADLVKLGSRLGVFFDIEGGSALDGQLSMVELYRDLGVRWMLIAYNRNNALGGGCMDVDRGLTRFGRQVVTEMERVGMTVCCSHTGFRTTMDVVRHATRPVIFSHSNPLGMYEHKRNVRDEAMKAIASTRGVVGINGTGIFLGHNDNSSETVANHVDYVVQKIGIDHVGLGLDYAFDPSEVDAFLAANPDVFPPSEGFAEGIRMVAPEQLRDIVVILAGRGYRLPDLRKMLGGNFARVARETWPTARQLAN